MRKFYSLLIAVLVTTIGFSQAPQKMSYQAVIRNSSDQLVTNHAVGMRISILKDATPVYVETQTPVTNTNGLASIEIGGGTLVSGTFAGIDWSMGTYFIKTETDPLGGTSYTITGTSQLLSVPYAMYAKTSGHYVGELFGGGIIVGLWRQGGTEHGLIASLTDIGTTTWSNIVSTEIGVTAQNPIDGQPNTNAIISQPGHTASAAKLCNDYTNTNTGTGIYSDWYLPALWELNQCYISVYVVNTILGVTNGFKLYSGACYWSSTENNNSTAYAIDFSAHFFGTDTGGIKGDYYNYVRAVRKF
jgi:hypothetical protein